MIVDQILALQSRTDNIQIDSVIIALPLYFILVYNVLVIFVLHINVVHACSFHPMLRSVAGTSFQIYWVLFVTVSSVDDLAWFWSTFLVCQVFDHFVAILMDIFIFVIWTWTSWSFIILVSDTMLIFNIRNNLKRWNLSNLRQHLILHQKQSLPWVVNTYRLRIFIFKFNFLDSPASYVFLCLDTLVLQNFVFFVFFDFSFFNFYLWLFHWLFFFFSFRFFLFFNLLNYWVILRRL